jgi:glucose-6-phosphate 1-dehydrogenase
MNRKVYRIDHYLGKETVQNLLIFRFSNPVFETLWNRDRVESVQIAVAEDVGLEGRVAYYTRAGALRNMVQNHLAQLLTLVAMEVPGAFDADAIKNEKVKVLRAIAPLAAEDVVFGQYRRGS